MTQDFDSGAARQARDFVATLQDDAEVAEFVQAARSHASAREFAGNLFTSGGDDAFAGLVPRGRKEDE
jgi:hypothetical protein